MVEGINRLDEVDVQNGKWLSSCGGVIRNAMAKGNNIAKGAKTLYTPAGSQLGYLYKRASQCLGFQAMLCLLHIPLTGIATIHLSRLRAHPV